MFHEKQLKFKSLDALKPIETIVNEAAIAAKDKKRTIENSAIASVLMSKDIMTKATLATIFLSPIWGMVIIGQGVRKRKKQLQEEKERLLKEVIEKQHAIIVALEREVSKTKERAEYLNSLNILLQQAVEDLQADLRNGVA